MTGTVFSFDRPDERTFRIDTLLPWLPPDSDLELNEENHVVRSSAYVVNTNTGDVTLYVRLRV